jgi:hypothetical protein
MMMMARVVFRRGLHGVREEKRKRQGGYYCPAVDGHENPSKARLAN